MNLSETTEGISWLTQFSLNDRPIARLFLDSLILVPSSNLIRDLHKLINQKASEFSGTVTLVPIREMKNVDSYYKPNRGKKKQWREARAKVLLSNSLPGSEAPIAHILTQLKRLDSKKFVTNPGLSNMRGAKTRTIFFVDDFIGSGNRVNEFLDAYINHPTIKSWYSYNWIRFHIFAYSVTVAGMKNVFSRTNRPPEQIHYLKKCPTFEQMEWTEMQRNAIEDICKRYAPSHKRQDYALGYKESRGMMIFEQSVPNNTPAILWAGSSSWQPLFPNRAVPSNLQNAFRLPPIDLNKILLKLGQPKLALGNWQDVANPFIKKIVLVLSAIANKSQTSHQISDMTNLSILEVEAIRTACQHWEMLDENYRLTRLGYDELNHALKVQLRFEQQFAYPEGFYYPQSLRKAR